MRKFSLLIVSLLLLFTACSPEIVQTLPSEDIKPNSSYVNVYHTANGDKLTVEFGIVPYANHYGYSINGKLPVTDLVNLSYIAGAFQQDIPLEGNGRDSIAVFAKTEIDDDWVQIAQKDFVLSLITPPAAYLSKRGDGYADIKVDSFLDSGNIIYKVVHGDSLELFTSNEFRLEGIENNEFEIEVSQSLAGGNFGAVQTLTIPAYDKNNDTSLEFHIEDGNFVVKSVPADCSEIVFAKYTDSLSDKIELGTVSVDSDGSARLPISSRKSLETGYFFAYDKTNEKKISNIEKYTTPIMVKDTIINWQSIELVIDFYNSDVLKSDSFMLQGALYANIEKTDSGIIIFNLNSNTKYEQLKLIASDYPRSTTYIFDVQTKSFAGIYEWVGKTSKDQKDHNFKVVVEEAPSDSPVGYYVFFHDEDETIIATGNVGKKFRIMPLIDPAFEPELESLEPVKNDNPGEYVEQNAAYRMNEKKWNSTNMSPKMWTIKSFEPSQDIVRTVTLAGGVPLISAGISEKLKTTTTFRFVEQQVNDLLSPTLLFENLGDGFVTVGLITNKSPKEELGENANTFCLQVSE